MFLPCILFQGHQWDHCLLCIQWLHLKLQDFPMSIYKKNVAYKCLILQIYLTKYLNTKKY